MVGSQDVHAEDAFEIFIGRVVELSYMRDACTVDQDVDTGELQNLVEYLFCRCRIGEVAWVRGRDSAELRDSFRCLLCGFAVQIYDADDSAMLGEAEGNRLTYTTSAACHQGHFVI